MAKRNKGRKARRAKKKEASMMVPPERETYAEGGKPSQVDNYIKNKKIVDDPDSTDKEKAFAQGVLDLLKPIDQGGNMSMNDYSNMMQGVDEEMAEKKRTNKQAGGSMLVPPEMGNAEVPVDTYPNIPPEEMAAVEASQLPDEQMEDDYVDFVMSEALDQEEQMYLMNTLEADPQLSMIFDKVVTVASEFSGSGEVAGPGSGVSDSIPARLSDGEFVMTKKATDQLGADNLQVMMDEAERAYDGGLMRGKDKEEELAGNMNKVMRSANQMPSLNVRQR